MDSLSIWPAKRRLGPTELEVSALAWGMWRFAGGDIAGARARIEAALDAGVTLFDTADVYGPDNSEPFGAAEALLGKVLGESGSLRGRLLIATKGGIVPGTPYDSSAAYLAAACEASLRRLRIEQIDLYQIHRPDLLTHPAEVAGVLERLRDQGKVREVGVSNHSPAQCAALQTWVPFPLASHQSELSPLAIGPLQDGVMDQVMAHRMSFLAWSPLAGGVLGGSGEDPRSRAVIAELDRLAEREGQPRTAVAYAWIMAHPARPIPIVGSQSLQRIREAAAAFQVRLDRADWYRVLAAARGAPLP